MPDQNQSDLSSGASAKLDPTQVNPVPAGGSPSDQPTSPPIFSPAADLPPIPPAFQSVPTDSPTDNSMGSAAPPTTPPVISAPKKKFGTGKIIATILGIFLLVGGLGAGVMLTFQPQYFEQLAKNGDKWNIEKGCVGSGCVHDGRVVKALNDLANSDNNPAAVQELKQAYIDIYKEGGFKEMVDVSKNPQNLALPNVAGGYTAAELAKFYGTVTEPLRAGYLCGTSGCASERDTNIAGYYCPNGCDLSTYGGSNIYYPITVQNNNGGGGDTTTTTTTPTASCQNVKIYSSTWVELTPAQLSALNTGTQVNLCAAGTASEGTFDMAKFTINGAVQPETTTVRPSSTDFCQLYTIPAATTTFNITAQIHHATLGWK